MRKKPLFLFLLPIFFVLHGFMEYYDLITIRSAIKVLLLYIVAAYLIAWLTSFIFKNKYKANLFTLFLLSVNFFFGPLYDFFDIILKSALLTKYAFLLPLVFLLLLFSIIWLKKIKQPSLKITFFTNTVLILLLITDSFFLIIKIYKQNNRNLASENSALIPAHVTDKPDIYFIVPDGYAGDVELKDVLQFDNNTFLQQLKDRGFHIIENSKSNYNWTIFSMASALNMSYLKIKDPKNIAPLLINGLRTVKHNRLFELLSREGYKINNFSIFGAGNKSIPMEESVFPSDASLLGGQTLLGHLIKIINYNISNKLKWKSFANRGIYAASRNNENIYTSTWNFTEHHDSLPQFTYTHLLMPHSPYYYDKNGNPFPFEKLIDGNQTNKNLYVEYLQYANKKLIPLIDHILQESAKPPIIIIMSDHGWRRFPKGLAKNYQFINLAAIYLPEKNYSAFKDSMSNVNMFRVLLNTRFGQNLPMLKDSSTYLERE